MSDSKGLTAQELADLEAYDPKAFAKVKAIQDEAEQLRASAAAAPAPAAAKPEFTPERFPPEMQDAIDQVNDLSDWQNDPKQQHLWRMAKAQDAILSELQAWEGKSQVERFAEVVKRVKELASQTPALPKTPEELAREVIAAAPVAAPPVTAGGLRGGESPTTQFPDYSRMTDEQVMASLGP